MTEGQDDEIEDFMDFLLENNAIEVYGVESETGEFLYRMTPKMRELIPALYEEHFNFINQMAFELWQKGYVEMKFEEKGPLVMLIEGLDYKEILNKVTYAEKIFLENMIALYNDDII
jgi:nitrate reductase NapAB chaperone NapD